MMNERKRERKRGTVEGEEKNGRHFDDLGIFILRNGSNEAVGPLPPQAEGDVDDHRHQHHHHDPHRRRRSPPTTIN